MNPNIATDGYGLSEAYRSNVPTNGYGGSLFTGYIEYLITLADTLLYQASLGEGPRTVLGLVDMAVQLLSQAEAVGAVLDEAEQIVMAADEASGLSGLDDGSVVVGIEDSSEGAIMGDTTTVSMVEDRTTVVTLTDTKIS